MRRLPWLLVAFVLAGGIASCGGGGSEDGEEACAPPGVLRVLARQGAGAPDTGGGAYGAFPLTVPLAAADGGWTAFVATVQDGSTAQVAYAVPPGGSPVRALAAGDAAPDASGGSIDTILAVWVSPSGWLLALVTVTGGGPGLGLVTARVAGDAVAETHGIVYDDEALDATGLGGTLTSISRASTHLTADGTVLFAGSTAAGDGFWRADPDGGGLALLVGTGSPLGGVRAVEALFATAVNDTGARYAFVAEQNVAGAPRGLYVGMLAGGGYEAVSLEGDEIADGETILALPADQVLVLYTATGSTGVLFEATNDAGEAQVLLGATDPVAPLIRIAGEGRAAPTPAGTTVDLGTYGPLGLLHNAPGAASPVFWAELVGGEAGFSFGLFGLQTGAPAPVVAFLDGAPAPPTGGDDFTAQLLGAAVEGHRDVAADGGLVLSNVLSSGQAGLFWLIPFCGQFAVARSGDATPDGSDVFGTSPQWRQTTANGVVLFRAPLTTAGSGILVRGP